MILHQIIEKWVLSLFCVSLKFGKSLFICKKPQLGCVRWALDIKQTCFGVSFDGKAAFPSVDRDIQVRELYTSGESGNLLLSKAATSIRTLCQ